MITAENLAKMYGPKTAVDGSRFTVRLGQVTGFVDPIGRSTAMRLIVGLDRPASGSVTVNGRPCAEHKSPLTEVAALLERRLSTSDDPRWRSCEPWPPRTASAASRWRR